MSVPALRWLAVLLPVSVALATGCSALDAADAERNAASPGSRSVVSGDPTCRADSDCAEGERCESGVCQIQRCASQNYASTAPLGRRRTFANDREILVVSDDTTRRLDGYEPTDGSFAHPSDMTIGFGAARIVDAAGGNLTGARAEAVAVALENATKLTLVSGDSRSDLDVGFVPVAVAAGDVDDDGTDEVVALAKDGTVAVCKAADQTCERRTIAGVVGKDLTVADVDGDGRAEPVVLVDVPGAKSALVVMNFDSATSNQSEQIRTSLDVTLARISSGVLEGSAGSVVALEDGGYADFASDSLHFFGMKDAKLAEVGAATTIAKDALDVLVTDTDGDDKPEVLVLEKSGLEVFRASGGTATPSTKTQLTASTSPTRLLAADLDGDSPVGTLTKNEPDLVPGPVVPMAVLLYPPYSRLWSDGTGSIGLGASNSKSDDQSQTVSLNASATVGFGIGFSDIAKTSLSVTVDKSWSTTHSQGRSISVGDSFSVDAKPELEGPDNGVAVLACACYHAYTYKVDDPRGRLGGGAVDGRLMSVFVPVGGQTALWSLKRYNTLAQKVGTLPTVQAPYTVGDVESYPTEMTKLDGSPIPDEDLLFTTPRAYRTSDVARVGWNLSVSQSESTTKSESMGISISGSLSVGPVSASLGGGASKTSSYSVSVGQSASFSGGVPPVRDDVKTPEDEHALHGYGFSPIVYRDRYKTPQGVEGGYYVVTYTVSH